MDSSFFSDSDHHYVAPSFLAADFLHIKNEVAWLEHELVDLIHLDVMDGQFVPNISFGLPVIEAINNVTEKPLDVHLMMYRPDYFISAFRTAGADIITVHYEVCEHLHRVVQQIKESGALAGVAINPHTPVTVIDDVLENLDLVLIMSVNPGFGGQKFIGRSLHKIETLKNTIVQRGLSCKIEVDGGVSPANARALVDAGADILVAGSAIFKSADRNKALDLIKNC